MKTSIIIPTYNRSHLLTSTLTSVQKQTYEDWECIIVDDGSTDDTKNIAENFCNRDHRFSFYERPSNKIKGANSCRNYGLEISKGEYIVFLDSDDLLLPNCLKGRIDFLSKKNVDLLISHTGVFYNSIGDRNLIWNKLNESDDIKTLLKRFFNIDIVWSTTGVIWSKPFIKCIGGWDETLSAWQDWELHVRALLNQPKYGFLLGEVDSYWRRESDFSIGSTYMSKDYMMNFQYLVLSIGNQLQKSNIDEISTLESFRHFTYLILIMKTLERGHLLLPLKLIFKPKFIRGIKRFTFIKIYCIQLAGTSFKLRNSFLKKTYNKQQEIFKVSSSHLKLTLDDLKL